MRIDIIGSTTIELGFVFGSKWGFKKRGMISEVVSGFLILLFIMIKGGVVWKILSFTNCKKIVMFIPIVNLLTFFIWGINMITLNKNTGGTNSIQISEEKNKNA